MKFTKKEELRVLEKFIYAMHGESFYLSKKIMETILEIYHPGGIYYLNELRKKYKEKIKTKKIKPPCDSSSHLL